MNKLFNPGDKIFGFCSGYFGRDDYDTKICILVNSKYAVFQYLEGDREGEAIVLNAIPGEENVVEWKQPDN